MESSLQFSPQKVCYKDWLECTQLSFEWAESYDTKDWALLLSILSPTVRVNYASVNNFYHEALPAADFVAMMSSPGFLGDTNLDTQHLLGASKFRQVAADEIEGKWQIRAAHQRYEYAGQGGPRQGPTAMTKSGERVVLLTGHSHATITISYRKIAGVWKWAGIETDIRWNESGFDKMFTGFEAGQMP